MIKDWKIAFWTPGNGPEDDCETFGCASHGFCTWSEWRNPDEAAVTAWAQQIKGTVLAGSYEDVLFQLENIGFTPVVAIAVFSKSSGMEAFIASFHRLFSTTPMIGGGAALGPGQSSGEILPRAEEVALLLSAKGSFKVEVTNIHTKTGGMVEFKAVTSRLIGRIKSTGNHHWMDALEYFRQRKKLGARSEEDFESLTFSDLTGRNIHCSEVPGGLKTGADLPENGRLVVRETTQAKATARMEEFVSVKDALVFGCAGLRSLLEHALKPGVGTLAGFMFGELITTGSVPMFGNLMMVRLVTRGVEV